MLSPSPPSPRVAGAVNRVWGGPLTVAGDVVLDEHRLAFRPTGPLAGLLKWHAFSVSLGDLLQLGWQSRARRLDLVTAGETLSFEGSTAPRIAAALAVRGVPFVDAAELSEGRGSLEALLRVEDATWVVPPLHHNGVVALGGAGLRFEPTGLVEQLAGFDGFAVAVADLRAARGERGGLRLTTAEGTQTLRVRQPGDWVGALAPLVARVALTDAPAPAGAPDAPVTLAFDAALEEPDRPTLTRGRAHLTASGDLSFWGLDGEVRTIPVEAVQRAVYGRASDDAAGVLALMGGDSARLRLHPCGGDAILSRLRDLALALPIAESVDLGSLGVLRKLQGAASFVRVTTDHRDAFTMRPGAVVQAPDAVGVVLSGDGGFRPPAGTRIRVVIGHDRGLLEIDGRVRRVVKDGAEHAHPGSAVLFVAVPHADNVRAIRTRRESYRVPASEPVTVRALRRVAGKAPMPWGPDRRGRLVDLSAGGCCLVLPRSVPVGTLVQADVLVEGRAKSHAAQVVFFARVHEDDAEMWRHGLRFEGLTEADHERLTREVQRRETRAVRQRAAEAEAAAGERGPPPQP